MFAPVTEKLAVRVLTEVPGPWWDDLCRAGSSPWHSLGMAGIQSSFGVRPRFLVLEKGSEPIGCLTFYVVGSRRAPLVDRAFMRTAYVPDGPVLPRPVPGAGRLLLDAVETVLEKEAVVSANVRFELPEREGAEALGASDYRVVPLGLAVADLPDAAEGVDRMIHSKSRNLVRKAEKSGVVVSVDEGLDDLLPLLDRSFERSGLPLRNHDYIRRVRELPGVEVLTARLKGRPVASLMWMGFGGIATYMFHGRDDGETGGASNLLLRDMFVRALRGGARRVQGGDVALPGATDPHLLGITHFKTRMGFQVKEGTFASKVFRPVAKAVRDRSLRLWNSFRS